MLHVVGFQQEDLTLFSSFVLGEEATCLWNGICGYNPLFEGDDTRCLNCYVNEPAHKLNNATAVQVLFEVCPHFREELGEDPSVCCSVSQVMSMKANYEQAKTILGTCPTCYDNWKKNFCASTCHPQMSDFIKVTQTRNITKQACGGALDSEYSLCIIIKVEVVMEKIAHVSYPFFETYLFERSKHETSRRLLSAV